MFTHKKNLQTVFFSFLLSQTLFSQITFQGTVTDNGGEYLGSGAEPVVNALVTLTNRSDTTHSYSVYTDDQGFFEIQVLPTGINDPANNPNRFRLLQNYPNPFNPSTVIGYQLPQPCHVKIEVYNITGQKMKTLLNGLRNTSGTVIWDGTNEWGNAVSAGVYIYTLQALGEQINRKMLLIDGGGIAANTNSARMENHQTPPKNLEKRSSSNQFILKVTGENIADYEELLEIEADITQDINVQRVMTGNDGKVYRTVKIADQWWTAENLKETQYRNGEPIPKVDGISPWSGLNTGVYTAYASNDVNAEIYGFLYNWHAVDDARNIAPAGWYVPTEEDWKELELALGMSQSEVDTDGCRGTDEGSQLAGSAYLWEDGLLKNNPAFDESGYNAKPGGGRADDFPYAEFLFLHEIGFFWSSTEHSTDKAFSRRLIYNLSTVGRYKDSKYEGNSVRLIKGESPSNTPPTASFTVEPGSGDPETVFHFDASGCTDAEDETSTLMVRWDWEDDDTWDTNYSTVKTATHQYPEPGTYTVKMKVMDSGNLTSRMKQTVEVAGPIYGTMTGNDGKIYQTVKIGDQWWTAENLKETQYRNGDAIPNVTACTEWSSLTTGAYCAYDNDESLAETYGYLYNGYAVEDDRKIAPAGWHVPTDQEWKILELALGMSPSVIDDYDWRGDNQGSKLAGNAALWNGEYLKSDAAFGESGFTALPAGYHSSATCDGSSNLGYYAYFWSSDGWSRILGYNKRRIHRDHFYRRKGISVRLVKGESPTIVEIEITPSTANCTIFGTQQFTCTAMTSDGGIHDRTREASWSLSPGTAGSIDSTGRFIAASTGTENIIATYGGYEATATLTVTVLPPDAGIMTGNDGRVYQTVKIGDQWWMAENLKETKYRNGEDIPNYSYWAYAANEINGEIYGYLYLWHVVNDTQNIAPAGWHVPTDEDWKELEMALGMSPSELDTLLSRGTDEGSKLAGSAYLWEDGSLVNNPAFNESGFNAKPAGYLYTAYFHFDFLYLHESSFFWSSTEHSSNYAYTRRLSHTVSTIRRAISSKYDGKSVRLVKN